MEQRTPLCIYHANCADGFAAAWAVCKYFRGRVDLHAANYGEAPPDTAGRDVILVDFSYKLPVIREICAKVRTLAILDHHASAIAELEEEAFSGSFISVFDAGRSGAMIAWDSFFGDQAPPTLLRHIEDRDLWRFKLPKTREISAALFSYPYDFDVWDALMARDVAELAEEGGAILRKHLKDIEELLPRTTRPMVIAGHTVPAANLPPTMASDAGAILARGEPFAAIYWDTTAGRQFSLRSDDGGMDVSAIAARLGGGGHKHAAGFLMADTREIA